jgi:hypothetical protein
MIDSKRHGKVTVPPKEFERRKQATTAINDELRAPMNSDIGRGTSEHD